MTDRELLELAAKAAGYELAQYQSNEDKAPLWLDRKHANPVTHSRDWNPLTDDGDDEAGGEAGSSGELQRAICGRAI